MQINVTPHSISNGYLAMYWYFLQSDKHIFSRPAFISAGSKFLKIICPSAPTL